MSGFSKRIALIYGLGAMIALMMAAVDVVGGRDTWMVWALLGLWFTRVVDRIADAAGRGRGEQGR